jgi:t-SNARE complex subunit (syntaxin)
LRPLHADLVSRQEIQSRLLANKRIEAQSVLSESNGENHEKSKEARQIEDFIETTREVEDESKACRRQVEEQENDKGQTACQSEKVRPS